MKIDFPAPHHLPQQRRLWQDAFGDTDAFLDSFFQTAYSADRCRCVFMGEDIAAILYWIDCTVKNQKLAYIYAVVTHPGHRGKGLCRMLMDNTHSLLRSQGYAGAILVPQKESLRKMYAGMGYRNAGSLTCFSCGASDLPVSLRAVGPAEFAALRRTHLPENAVIQEGDGLVFLAQQLQFYAGANFLLAAYGENGILSVPELLGDASAAPGILKALGYSQGNFRIPGSSIPFAMFHPLTDTAISPSYFGFAFD